MKTRVLSPLTHDIVASADPNGSRHVQMGYSYRCLSLESVVHQRDFPGRQGRTTLTRFLLPIWLVNQILRWVSGGGAVLRQERSGERLCGHKPSFPTPSPTEARRSTMFG